MFFIYLFIVFYRNDFEKIVTNYKQQANMLQDRIADLETNLASKSSELLHEKQIKEDLMNQAFNAVQSQDTERMFWHLF